MFASGARNLPTPCLPWLALACWSKRIAYRQWTPDATGGGDTTLI